MSLDPNCSCWPLLSGSIFYVAKILSYIELIFSCFYLAYHFPQVIKIKQLYFSVIYCILKPLFSLMSFYLWLQYPGIEKVCLLVLSFLFFFLFKSQIVAYFPPSLWISEENYQRGSTSISIKDCGKLLFCILIILLILAMTSYSVINLCSLNLTSVFGKHKQVTQGNVCLLAAPRCLELCT